MAAWAPRSKSNKRSNGVRPGTVRPALSESVPAGIFDCPSLERRMYSYNDVRYLCDIIWQGSFFHMKRPWTRGIQCEGRRKRQRAGRRSVNGDG